MRILYIAKHDSGGNDDEGAIHFALEQLGHSVYRVRESVADAAHRGSQNYDFCLFHKWEDAQTLAKIKCPKVFWYFDLVDYPDPAITDRCRRRISWMQRAIPLVDLGFCTDGDWVANWRGADKLVWLMQGADERVVGRGTFASCKHCGEPLEPPVDILFTGCVKNGGTQRQSFVAEMRERYGARFKVVENGVHGRAMADLIASAKIVVAPDGPVTDRYWSNRVYNVLGFGGFLLHPWCDGLAAQYCAPEDLVFYRSRRELYQAIDYYLSSDDTREITGLSGIWSTKHRNLYRHRCEQLVSIAKERLKL